MNNDHKELINTLNDVLDKTIKSKLQAKGKAECEREIIRVRGCLIQAFRQPSFQHEDDSMLEVVNTLKNVINKIDAKIKDLEIECGGVMNYSLNFNERIDELAYKIELKKTLSRMLNKIYQECPELQF